MWVGVSVFEDHRAMGLLGLLISLQGSIWLLNVVLMEENSLDLLPLLVVLANKYIRYRLAVKGESLKGLELKGSLDRLDREIVHQWTVETLESEHMAIVDDLIAKQKEIVDGLLSQHKAVEDGLLAQHRAVEEDLMAKQATKVAQMITELASVKAAHQFELQERTADAFQQGISNERQRHLDLIETQRREALVDRQDRVSELEDTGRRCVRLKQHVRDSEDPRCMNPIPGRGKYVNNMGLCSTHYQMHMAGQAKSYEIANKRLRSNATTARQVLK